MPQPNNFYAQFATAAARRSDHLAVEVQRRESVDRFTYAELHSMAERAAAFLAMRGLRPGERAAILADNDARWCAAYLGTLRLGGVAVPLDTAYKPKQIAKLLRDCEARVLFTTQRYLSAAGEAAAISEAQVVLLDGCVAGVESLHDVFAQPSAENTTPPPCPAGPDDPAVILYTSGTTSDPKGVVLTHANLLAEMDAALRVVHVDERDCILAVLPLFHALAQMANLLLPFSIGGRVVFLETLNSTEMLRALRERGVTAFCCVPQFFYLIHQRVAEEVAAGGFPRRVAFRALLALNGWLRDLAGLNLGPALFRRAHEALGREMRLLVTGGSRFDPKIGRDLYRLGFSLLQAYGLTETSGAATVTRPGSKYTDSVGPPLPGVEVRIAPSKSTPGEATAIDSEQIGKDGALVGEVLIRGPIVMQGYFNRPDATAAALEDGWLHTGDLGFIDSRGELRITGRLKEIIVLSSGKNIYPEEIEEHYLQSPYIKEICVLGLTRPEEPAAERLHAVVVPNFNLLRERKVLNTRELLRFEIENLSIQLPSHKRILSFEVWTSELPRTTTRKLKRFEIEQRVGAEAAASETQRQEETLGTEEQAWATRPEVARALELVREAAKPPDAVRADANIELDLGLDSIERVELLTRLQQMFGTQVPEEVAHRIYTVRELVEACVPQQASPPGPSGSAAPERGAWPALLEPPREETAEYAEWAELLRTRRLFPGVTFVLAKLCYGLARLMFRFRVSGRENLPPQGPYLICPNHQTYIDPFLLVSALPFRVFRNTFFVGASEYFATPRMRRVARLINLIAVDPDTNLLRAMQAGAFGLRHGKVLILFPEGERSIDGEVKKFKKGAAILAHHLRVPIVPVALDGAFDLWPRGRSPRWRNWLPGGGGRVRMAFGKPLEPPDALPTSVSSSQAEARYAAFAEHLRAVVLALWQSLRQELAGK